MTKPKRTPPSPPPALPDSAPTYTPSPPEVEALSGYFDLGGHVIMEGV